MFEMFADATVGESYHENRLITEETDAGTVSLTAYGWMKLAEYDETEGHVTVFFGHKNIESRTISRWLNSLLEVARSRGRSVTISDESPTVRKPNDAVEYIGGYVGNFSDMSPVEQEAHDNVLRSLSYLNTIV